MHQLKSFRYHHCEIEDNTRSDWDCGNFLAAVRKSSAGHTPEQMLLRADESTMLLTGICSFRKFDKLRWLELDVSLLLGRSSKG
jgi:hypothetical protein